MARPNANRTRAPLVIVGIVAFALGIFSIVLAAAGGHVAVVFAFVALFVVGLVSVWLFTRFSRLTRAGLESASPWNAYQQGLEDAATDDGVVINLDEILPDAVALGVGRHLGDRLEAANENGEAIRAFASQQTDSIAVATFPWWIAFNSVVTSSSGAGAGVSGGGAGGGGGAAGST